MINMTVRSQGCVLGDEANTSKGTLILKPFDSHEKGMIWDRLTLDVSLPKGSKITGHFIGTDDEELYKQIRNPMIHELGKIDLLKHHNPELIHAPQDALLHHIKGRYLLGWLTVFAPETSPILKKVRVYYPKQSLLDYLPEVYGNSEHADFLHRYLSIYRSILMDLEESIDVSPIHLLADIGTQADIWWLAESLGLESPEIWDEKELRNRVLKAIELSGLRGTRKGIEELSKFITELDCFIIEQHDLGRKKADSHLNQLYDKLYGSQSSDFTILVPDDGLASERIYNQMKKALDSVKPAYTSARLVSLQPYLRLDQHAYLGINTTINNSH